MLERKMKKEKIIASSFISPRGIMGLEKMYIIK